YEPVTRAQRRNGNANAQHIYSEAKH
ncbi:MAG: hypothetical protein ACI8PT_004165, partial [Gammaproteobacteria bacterium]